MRYAIKAIFTDQEGRESGLTYYDEKLFYSEGEAIEAINSPYGDDLVSASMLDCETAPDLVGLMFHDLVPYLLGGN